MLTGHWWKFTLFGKFGNFLLLLIIEIVHYIGWVGTLKPRYKIKEGLGEMFEGAPKIFAHVNGARAEDLACADRKRGSLSARAEISFLQVIFVIYFNTNTVTSLLCDASTKM